MSASCLYGLSWTLPTLLGLSAGLRSTDLDRSQIFVVQTLPRWAWVRVDSRTWVRLIVTGEVAAALLLLPFPDWSLSVREAGGAVLAAMFVAIVGRALAMHIACGCFPGRRPAEWADLTRSLVLFLEAATVGVVRPRFAGGGGGIAAAFVVLGIGVALPFAAARLVWRAGGHGEEGERAQLDGLLALARVQGLALSELLIRRENTAPWRNRPEPEPSAAVPDGSSMTVVDGLDLGPGADPCV